MMKDGRSSWAEKDEGRCWRLKAACTRVTVISSRCEGKDTGGEEEEEEVPSVGPQWLHRPVVVVAEAATPDCSQEREREKHLYTKYRWSFLFVMLRVVLRSTALSTTTKTRLYLCSQKFQNWLTAMINQLFRVLKLKPRLSLPPLCSPLHDRRFTFSVNSNREHSNMEMETCGPLPL